jgi:tRNA threonylcarbamoyl adenosine modification protein YeaZ
MSPDQQLILGIETATINCSVGLTRGELILGQKNLTDRAVHSEKLIDLIDALLRPHTDFAGLAAVAVSIGPGSYTGLRIGLATAKGLTFSGTQPLLPVPTLTVLENVARRQFSGPAVFFIKSHRDLIYYTVAGKDESPVFRRKVAHDRIAAVAQLYPDHLLIGDNDFNGQYGKRLQICFPAGDAVAQLAARYYDETQQLSNAELEPDYYSNLEAKTWPTQ